MKGTSNSAVLCRIFEVPLTDGDNTCRASKNLISFGSPRPNGSCEKIQNSLKTRREGTPPPLIRRELQPLLEARCPHRANFFTAPRGRGVRGEGASTSWLLSPVFRNPQPALSFSNRFS